MRGTRRTPLPGWISGKDTVIGGSFLVKALRPVRLGFHNEFRRTADRFRPLG